MSNYTPIVKDIFDAAFKESSAPPFKPLTKERAKELIAESIKYHEEVYLPAEQKEIERLGRPLGFLEQLALSIDLKLSK